MTNLTAVKLTIDKRQFSKIRKFVSDHYIPTGIGTTDSACSIASINLALEGRLTDDIPACMSPIIGEWIIRVQDEMPDDLRNDKSWKNLLPYAAGTGRKAADEKKRQALIFAWFQKLAKPLLLERAKKDTPATFKYIENLIRVGKPVRPSAICDALSEVSSVYSTWEIEDFASDLARYLDPELANLDLEDTIMTLTGNIASGSFDEFWKKANPAALLRKLILVGL
jgi:hypothetical protein